MAPRFGGGAGAARGAAAASHDIPASHQRPGLAGHGSTDVAQQLQQLNITPLARYPGSSASSHAVPLAAGAGPAGAAAPASPLDLLPAAPLALDVTPLMAGLAARPPAAAAASTAEARGQASAAGVLADLPAAGPLNVSPLSTSNSPAGGGRRGSPAELCISPLPGMRSEAAGPAQQRSPLGERSTNSSGRGGSFASSLAAAQPHMLPALAPPLPQAGDEEPAAALNGSPSFAENLPLPSPVAPAPGGSKQQQERSRSGAAQEPGLAGVHKIKAAPTGAVVATPPAALTPAASGGFQQWSIGAVPSVEAQPQQGGQGTAAAAATPTAALPAVASGMPSSAEFSFAAAQRSAEELGASGAAWTDAVAGLCEAGPAAAAGAGGPLSAPDVGPSSEAAALRDNLLAMHLDMLTQFQVSMCGCGWVGGWMGSGILRSRSPCVCVACQECGWAGWDGWQAGILMPACIKDSATQWGRAGSCAAHLFAHWHAQHADSGDLHQPPVAPFNPRLPPWPPCLSCTPSALQAQQECMGQLVGQVLEQNQVLSDEVAALRRQLATLTSRRDEFLWL